MTSTSSQVSSSATVGLILLLSSTLTFQAQQPQRSHSGQASLPYCSSVTGRYAIYANNDFLRIDGSRHLLVTVSDELDHKLEHLGWEDHAAVGMFRICYARDVNPSRLTREDRVEIAGFSGMKFVKGTHQTHVIISDVFEADGAAMRGGGRGRDCGGED
jgi:hypothetical protein